MVRLAGEHRRVEPRPVARPVPDQPRCAPQVDGVEEARKVYSLYNAEDKLALDEPLDYNRLPEATQDRIIQWMGQNMR